MIAKWFQRLYPCFRGRATRRDKRENCPMPGYAGNGRGRPFTGSWYDATSISASIHDSNDYPMDRGPSMFSESGYTNRRLRRTLDVWISCEVKMSSANRKLLSVMLNSLHLQMLSSVRSVVLVPNWQTQKTWEQPLEIRCYCRKAVRPVGNRKDFWSRRHRGCRTAHNSTFYQPIYRGSPQGSDWSQWAVMPASFTGIRGRAVNHVPDASL